MWSELEDEISADESYLVSAEDLGELREEIRLALQSGPLPERKALMQTLVAEIRVRDRSWIQPVFRVRFFDHRMDRCPRGIRPAGLDHNLMTCGNGRPAPKRPGVHSSGADLPKLR
jgi:hypothetical protein